MNCCNCNRPAEGQYVYHVQDMGPEIVDVIERWRNDVVRFICFFFSYKPEPESDVYLIFRFLMVTLCVKIAWIVFSMN